MALRRVFLIRDDRAIGSQLYAPGSMSGEESSALDEPTEGGVKLGMRDWGFLLAFVDSCILHDEQCGDVLSGEIRSRIDGILKQIRRQVVSK